MGFCIKEDSKCIEKDEIDIQMGNKSQIPGSRRMINSE